MFKKIISLAIAAFSLSLSTQAPATDQYMSARKSLGSTIVLDKGNHLSLVGPVDGKSAAALAQSILTAKEDQILVINSPGGSVFAGLQVVEALQSTKVKVTCVAKMAVSMAFVIFQACHERVVMPHSIVMQHVASYSLEGREPNNYTFARFLHTLVEEMDSEQAQRIGLSLDDFRAKTVKDWWMVGNEAVEANVADRFARAECTPELSAATKNEIYQIFIFEVKIKTSGCPLMSGPLDSGTDNKTGARPSRRAEEALEDFLTAWTIDLTNIRSNLDSVKKINEIK